MRHVPCRSREWLRYNEVADQDLHLWGDILVCAGRGTVISAVVL